MFNSEYAFSANLIVNGDFEAGNSGFTSDYADGVTDLSGRTYMVIDNPSDYHSLASSYGDHTSGSGLMMAVNGWDEVDKIVWSQTITVSPNTEYSISAWISTWYSPSPAELQFLINSNSIGIVTAPSTTAAWENFSTTWNSGATISASIEIIDLNTDGTGNDFALDDISMNVVPEPISSTLFLIGGATLGFRRLRKSKVQ